MVSRARLAAILAVVASTCVPGAGLSQPPVGTSIYTVRVDPRLCPSPLCGGYWVALANRALTRCADGALRPRCYVARAVDEHRHPLETSIPDQSLVRADLESWDFEGFGKLGVLAIAVVFTPAGSAPASGSYQRLVDTGIRCVRAPCFSLRATRVNGTTRTKLSDVDLAAAVASPPQLARAQAALRSKNGLLAQGRLVSARDGGRVFRASRLYLRVP